MNPKLSRFSHILMLVGGALAMFAPDLTSLADMLKSRGVGGWAIDIAIKVLGFLALVGANWPHIRGRLQSMGVVDLPVDVQTKPEKPSNVIPGPGAVALLVLGAALLAAGAAEAQSYGGCFVSGRLCAGPSASITVVSFNLADSTFAGGVSPGVGYGLTFTPPSAPWAAVGLDLYASFRLGQSLPNQGAFGLMTHFADYIFLGIGPTVTQRTGESALVQWSLLGGIGIPIELGVYRERAKAGQ